MRQMKHDQIPTNFKYGENRKLVIDYINFRLNPEKEAITMPKITENRAKKIIYSIKKFDSEIKKPFLNYSVHDLESFFEKLNHGELKKTTRIKVKAGNIPVLKQRVPFSKTAFYNLKSDFKKFWTFLVYKYDVKDLFLFINKK